MQPWYETAWRRAVLDMHIADDPSYLQHYDPAGYAAQLVQAGARSAVVTASSHVGAPLYPSKVAPPHRALAGRDLFGETLAACHRAEIGVVAYLSVIFDVAAYRREPAWRILRADGTEAASDNRYGVCCPNAPYRDYAAAVAREVCERYVFEGVRFDMTFWPTICYCPHCRRRFAAEVGGELPTVVDWEDPRWVSFQRCRERWLAEFAGHLTASVRAVRPELSVEHQASTYTMNWRFGVTDLLAEHNDFLQGDFYGDSLQGSIARKLLTNLSRKKPIAFETSIGISLSNFTTLKSPALLAAKAHAAVADGAAFVFIDTVDPVGTTNPEVYRRMGPVFGATQGYEAHLGGERVEEVALYLGFWAKHDPSDNGKQVTDPTLSGRVPHLDALTGAAAVLRARHVPWGIVTSRNLAVLSKWRVVVVPGAVALSESEARGLAAYVRGGGRLYLSGRPRVLAPDGREAAGDILGELLGVSWSGVTVEGFTYMAPAAAGRGAPGVLGGYTERHPLGLPVRQVLARARGGAAVLATVTLPYTDPSDPSVFSSIHCNPPGRPTEHAAIVRNTVGKGVTLWTAAPLEAEESGAEVFGSLVDSLAAPYRVGADAPATVELTAFEVAGLIRRVCLLSFPKELPATPVEGARVRITAPAGRRATARLVPGGESLAVEQAGDIVTIHVPRLEVLRMVEVDW